MKIGRGPLLAGLVSVLALTAGCGGASEVNASESFPQPSVHPSRSYLPDPDAGAPASVDGRNLPPPTNSAEMPDSGIVPALTFSFPGGQSPAGDPLLCVQATVTVAPGNTWPGERVVWSLASGLQGTEHPLVTGGFHNMTTAGQQTQLMCWKTDAQTVAPGTYLVMWAPVENQYGRSITPLTV